MATDATSYLAGSKDVFAASGLANTLTFANSIDVVHMKNPFFRKSKEIRFDVFFIIIA